MDITLCSKYSTSSVNDYCPPFPCYLKKRKSGVRAKHVLTSSRFISTSWSLTFFCRRRICCTCSMTLRLRISILLLRSSDTWLYVLSLSEKKKVWRMKELLSDLLIIATKSRKFVYKYPFPFNNDLFSGHFICVFQIY